jgi:hypothetical protein
MDGGWDVLELGRLGESYETHASMHVCITPGFNEVRLRALV